MVNDQTGGFLCPCVLPRTKGLNSWSKVAVPSRFRINDIRNKEVALSFIEDLLKVPIGEWNFRGMDSSICETEKIVHSARAE